MENDPHEIRNLAVDPAHADKLKQLRELCVKEFRRTRCDWDVETGPHFADLFPESKQTP